MRHGPPELYSYTALYTIQLYSAIHYTTSTTPLWHLHLKSTPIRAPANPSFERPTPTPVDMSIPAAVCCACGAPAAASPLPRARFRAASVGFQRAFSSPQSAFIFVCAGKATLSGTMLPRAMWPSAAMEGWPHAGGRGGWAGAGRGRGDAPQERRDWNTFLFFACPLDILFACPLSGPGRRRGAAGKPQRPQRDGRGTRVTSRCPAQLHQASCCGCPSTPRSSWWEISG